MILKGRCCVREFIILIGELIIIAAIQTVIEAVFKEWKLEKQMTVVNIACVLVSYILLIRFVYNNFFEELTTLVNFTF